MNSSKVKSGFTLIELLMVVTIIGIISVLAIQKLSGLKDNAKETANIANMQRVSAGVEAYLTAHTEKGDSSINRLDSLMVWTKGNDGTGGTLDLTDTTRTMFYTNTVGNVGISRLFAGANPYGAQVRLIGTYYLSDSDAAVLRDKLGLTAVMAGADENNPLSGYGENDELNSWVAQSIISSPDTCAGYARLCTNGLPVAVINPGASSGRTPWGVNIYRSCGVDVSYNNMGSLYVGGKDCGSGTAGNEAAFKELMAGEGILMAFGLGERCSLVGSAEGGFTKAPISPVMDPDQYRRYILLVKVRYTAASGRGGTTTYTAKSAQFAGVMDPNGNVLSMLQ